MIKKNILVTGGAGFIGANFLNIMVPKYQHYRFVNLDKITYAANLDHLKNIDGADNYKFIKGDICKNSFIQQVFLEEKITDIIHFAAESHVDNSISGPREFIETNILGTFNLLDCARRGWMDSPQMKKEEFSDSRFHHISTDEVYGSLGEAGFFTEETSYSPNSPYSASKASSDHLVRSYFHTYGLNVVTTNCSNNYGPFQHEEKLIPVIIKNAISGNSIPIYGKGNNIRDWLFVEDHCNAIMTVFEKGVDGETYNIGTNNEVANIDLCKKICRILDSKVPLKSGKYEGQIEFVQDRPGHDVRYAIDSSKIQNELGWSSFTSFDDGLDKTIEWYLNCFQNS